MNQKVYAARRCPRAQRRRIARAGLAALAVMTGSAGAEVEFQWSSDRQHRLMVRVDPVEGMDRPSDELVARVEVDFQEYLGQDGADLSSLQVVGYDSETGSPVPYALNPFASRVGELPSRFYDASIPWDYPEREGYVGVHNQDGSGKPIVRVPGGGRFTGVVGDGRKGVVAWAHTQKRQSVGYYAIYFNGREPGTAAGLAIPGFIGDGSNRCARESLEFFPTMSVRVDVVDLDGDDLFDLIAGDITGKIVWHRNIGSSGQPVFDHPQLLYSDDGDPIDVGYLSGPRAADWDGDGDLDLIIGAERESVVFYRNVGNETSRKYHLEGLLEADGRAIVVPRVPCAEDRNGAMASDYAPVPDVVDWDGDGDLDLLLGGFVTGYIWLYENTADKSDLDPVLTFRGALKADGKALDVTWMAAPTVADFDGDGDLDLVSGAWQWEWGTGGKSDVTRFLMYYENVGTRESPVLEHRYPFPAEGQFRHSSSGTPRAVDFNRDGLLDLVVSTRSDLLLVPNVGRPNAPRFDASVPALKARWGNESLRMQQLVDYNGDGWADLFTGDAVDIQRMPALFSAESVKPGSVGNRSSFSDSAPIRFLAEGKRIYHESEQGDHWDYRILADLNGDEKMDILVGDNAGHLWFHRDEGEKGQPRVDPEGKRLRLKSGDFLSVFDAPASENVHSHDDLQGARPTMATGDFNHDGLTDLIVCNTYGVIQLFLRSGPGEVRYEPGRELARVQKIRLTAQAIDWNADGWDDIVATYAGGDTFVIINRAQEDQAVFSEAEPVEIPRYWMSWPFVHVADWNHDGDQDLIFHNGIMMRFVERSILKHGYVEGRVVGVERNRSARRLPGNP